MIDDVTASIYTTDCGAYKIQTDSVNCIVIIHDDHPTHLPAMTKIIQDEAFVGSARQEKIIPNGTLSIARRTFAECSNLVLITLPDEIEFIAPDAFADCDQLSIVCSENSYAQFYAEARKIPYIVLN